jgi:hypothetical protein
MIYVKKKDVGLHLNADNNVYMLSQENLTIRQKEEV